MPTDQPSKLSPKPDNTPPRNGSAGNPERNALAKERRQLAVEIALVSRGSLFTVNNREIDRYPLAPTSFHKGLPHDEFGMVESAAIFDAFVAALNRDGLVSPDAGGQGRDDRENRIGSGAYAKFDVPLGPPQDLTFRTIVDPGGAGAQVRNWESPLAGHAMVLEGPDPGAVAMAPAPTLVGDELAAEIAEVYAMALLRDVDFSNLANGGTKPPGKNFTVKGVVDQLNQLTWFDARKQEPRPSYAALTGNGLLTLHEKRRRRARFEELSPGAGWSEPKQLTPETLFRGSVPGAKIGPYLSQFMLIGTRTGGVSAPVPCCKTANAAPAEPSGTAGASDGGAELGYIVYGAQRIDQRVLGHLPGRDHMTEWRLWLDVQNGANLKGADSYREDRQPRFIATPRDLATYVHFDQLYQAYLNAALLLLAYEVPADLGFPSGEAHRTRGSFATFGGPHILSLLTEVASRALRAVRRQKFQHHLRGRPEQLAAMLSLASCPDCNALGAAEQDFAALLANLKGRAPDLLAWIAAHNKAQNDNRAGDPGFYPRLGTTSHVGPDLGDGNNYLLPMAFPEGSPMHASYGAGHATVAGACVTMLKAFFELSTKRIDAGANGVNRPVPGVDRLKREESFWTPATFGMDGDKIGLGLTNVWQAPASTTDDHYRLERVEGVEPTSLTIEGELNKLAANISIGRNMAGVHFYTDYYDSLRMGERIAVGILQEQMTTYLEPLTMRLTSFDGDRLIIEGDGRGGGTIHVRNHGETIWANDAVEWWSRHVAEFQGL